MLLVSHDRDFLDRLATSILAVEGNGDIGEYVGGYSDYQAQRRPPSPSTTAKATKPPTTPREERPRGTRKLSFRDQRELDELPDRLETLQQELAALHARLDDPTFYGRDPEGFTTATARLHAAESELSAAEERWLELEMQREALKS
ncbi:MAG: hypothetical protein ABT940_11660 [Alphaproteobacteria bacterium]